MIAPSWLVLRGNLRYTLGNPDLGSRYPGSGFKWEAPKTETVEDRNMARLMLWGGRRLLRELV